MRPPLPVIRRGPIEPGSRLQLPAPLYPTGSPSPTRNRPSASLHKIVNHGPEGALRRRHHEQQTEQMWCLTLATDAIVTWSTEYFGLAVTALRHHGRRIDDDVLTRIWPSQHENVHFYGSHAVNVDRELAALDTDGYRPLRLPATSSWSPSSSARPLP